MALRGQLLPRRKKNQYVHVVCIDCGYVVIGAKIVYFAIPTNWVCRKCNPKYNGKGMVTKGMLVATVLEE